MFLLLVERHIRLAALHVYIRVGVCTRLLPDVCSHQTTWLHNNMDHKFTTFLYLNRKQNTIVINVQTFTSHFVCTWKTKSMRFFIYRFSINLGNLLSHKITSNFFTMTKISFHNIRKYIYIYMPINLCQRIACPLY